MLSSAAVSFTVGAVALLALVLWVEEPRVQEPQPWREAVHGVFRQLAGTFREVRRLRVVFPFLLGYRLYIDGVDTIVRMGGGACPYFVDEDKGRRAARALEQV